MFYIYYKKFNINVWLISLSIAVALKAPYNLLRCSHNIKYIQLITQEYDLLYR